MASSIFSHKPHLSGCLTRIIWVIPILVIPAGIVIYYTEGKNLIQLLSLIGFGIGIPLILYLLITLTNKYISKNARLQVREDATLFWKVRKKSENINLLSVNKINILTRPGNSEIQIYLKTTEIKKLIYPGNFSGPELDGLKAALQRFHVPLI